jgi:hypothetical protein
MRVMSKKQEGVLQKLIRLANGDSLLVERAIRNAGTAAKPPTLSEVVSYIKSQTTHRKRA